MKRAAGRVGDRREIVKYSRAGNCDVSLRRRHDGATIILHPDPRFLVRWRSSQRDIPAAATGSDLNVAVGKISGHCHGRLYNFFKEGQSVNTLTGTIFVRLFQTKII